MILLSCRIMLINGNQTVYSNQQTTKPLDDSEKLHTSNDIPVSIVPHPSVDIYDRFNYKF